MKRSLSLRREALSELAAGDLGAVAGGQYSGNPSCLPPQCAYLTEAVNLNAIKTVLDRPTIDVNRCPTLLC